MPSVCVCVCVCVCVRAHALKTPTDLFGVPIVNTQYGPSLLYSPAHGKCLSQVVILSEELKLIKERSGKGRVASNKKRI